MYKFYQNTINKICYKINAVHQSAIIQFTMSYTCFTLFCPKSFICCTRQKCF